MKFSEMLQTQYDQQLMFEGKRPADRAEQRRFATEYALYLMGEVHEYLDAIAYKRHLAANEAPRATRLNEVVDILKYAMAIAWAEGFNAIEITEAFYAKTQTVYARRQRELDESKIASFDIDGVLADITAGGYKRDWDIGDIDAWMAEGNILKLPIIPETTHIVRSLKRQGWSIVLTTSRKRHRHANIEYETYRWLKQHDIPCDYISWSYDKSEGLAEAGIKPVFHVEDTPKHALDMASWGVHTFLIGHTMPDSFSGEGEKIHPCTYVEFSDVLFSWLENMNGEMQTGICSQ